MEKSVVLFVKLFGTKLLPRHESILLYRHIYLLNTFPDGLPKSNQIQSQIDSGQSEHRTSFIYGVPLGMVRT